LFYRNGWELCYHQENINYIQRPYPLIKSVAFCGASHLLDPGLICDSSQHGFFSRFNLACTSPGCIVVQIKSCSRGKIYSGLVITPQPAKRAKPRIRPHGWRTGSEAYQGSPTNPREIRAYLFAAVGLEVQSNRILTCLIADQVAITFGL